jgi:hypothetical protein
MLQVFSLARIELLKARIEAMGPRNTRYIQIQQIGDAAACKCQCKPVAVGELLHQQAALADSTTESDILFQARNSAKICPVDLVKLIDNKDDITSSGIHLGNKRRVGYIYIYIYIYIK